MIGNLFLSLSLAAAFPLMSIDSSDYRAMILMESNVYSNVDAYFVNPTIGSLGLDHYCNGISYELSDMQQYDSSSYSLTSFNGSDFAGSNYEFLKKTYNWVSSVNSGAYALDGDNPALFGYVSGINDFTVVSSTYKYFNFFLTYLPYITDDGVVYCDSIEFCFNNSDTTANSVLVYSSGYNSSSLEFNTWYSYSFNTNSFGLEQGDLMCCESFFQIGVVGYDEDALNDYLDSYCSVSVEICSYATESSYYYGLGYADGYGSGYNEGYADGLELADNGDFMSLFNGIADTPLRFIYGLFNFDLFGVNVLIIILSLLTFIFVFHIIKKVWK